jgi:PAS domain S-box-containing protein
MVDEYLAPMTQTLVDARALIESACDAIVAFSASGKVLCRNRAAEGIFGWAVGDPISDGPDGVNAEQARAAQAVIRQVAATGHPVQNVEFTWRRDHGRPMTLMLSMSPVRDRSGRLAQVLCIAVDVSERRQLESEALRHQRDEAAQQERELLARELHDNLSQNLSFVQMQVATARALLNQGQTEAADALLIRLEEVAEDTQTYVREQIRSLFSRPKQQAFLPALRALAADFTHGTDIQVDLRLPPVEARIALTSDVENQFLRIVQETLANVRKHAGARNVAIRIEPCDDSLIATIEDDGRGFDMEQMRGADGKHYGLRIMQQRAEMAGGSLEVVSAPGRGTRVSVHLPCKPHKAARGVG